MNTPPVLVQDILDSAEKFGETNVLHWEPNVFRDNKKNNKNAKYDCTWIPFEFKLAKGGKTQLKVKIIKVLNSSAAKASKATEEDKLKHLQITFREVTKDEVAVGDHIPKEMDSEELQEIENKRVEDEVNDLCKRTNDFARAMEILDKSYQKICNDILTAKSLDFTVRKNKQFKTNKDIPIFPLRQTTREDKEDKDKIIKLEYPLTRIRLPINEQGLVGTKKWDSTGKCWNFIPNVFDSRKMKLQKDKSGKIVPTAPVLATVKINNKRCPLDKENANQFITYRSVLGGVIEFHQIVVSKFGLSLSNGFKELYVRRNKSNMSESEFSSNDMKDMIGDDNNDDNESDVDNEVNEVNEVNELINNIDKLDIEENSSLGDPEIVSDLEDECEEV